MAEHILSSNRRYLEKGCMWLTHMQPLHRGRRYIGGAPFLRVRDKSSDSQEYGCFFSLSRQQGQLGYQAGLNCLEVSGSFEGEREGRVHSGIYLLHALKMVYHGTWKADENAAGRRIVTEAIKDDWDDTIRPQVTMLDDKGAMRSFAAGWFETPLTRKATTYPHQIRHSILGQS
jgi:hypothetical protein